MKARHRPAGDGDEQEGKEAAGEHRPRAVDEPADRRHFQIGPDDENADRQRGDRADLEEGRQIVARRQQQPHRQHRGDEAIGDQHEGQRLALEGEQRRQSLALRDIAPQREAGDQQHEADQRHLEDAAGAQIAAVDAHQYRDRQGREDGEGAPWAVGQRLDDNEAEHREQNDHDRENAEHSDEPGGFAHFGFDQIAERAAVAAGRDEQDQHVLHRAGEDDADHQPQRAGQIPHLRGENRADQRAGAGDGREMMTEQHIFVCRHIVEPVVAAMRRRRAIGVEPQQLARDKQSIKAIADQIDANRGGDQPQRVDAFPARDREREQREHRGGADGGPQQDGQNRAGGGERSGRHACAILMAVCSLAPAERLTGLWAGIEPRREKTQSPKRYSHARIASTRNRAGARRAGPSDDLSSPRRTKDATM